LAFSVPDYVVLLPGRRRSNHGGGSGDMTRIATTGILALELEPVKHLRHNPVWMARHEALRRAWVAPPRDSPRPSRTLDVPPYAVNPFSNPKTSGSLRQMAVWGVYGIAKTRENSVFARLKGLTA
jgi:hypothetical protein